MKKFLTILFVLVAALFYSQSLTPTGNYVYSRNYLEAVTSEQPNASQIQGVQYYDGLGRSTQNIAIKATPTGKDLVVPIVYDDSGKQTKSYLPLPVDSQNGAFFPNVGESNVNSYYGVQNAYSEVLYEKSPLGRIEKQAAPGAEWQMGGTHIKKIEYLFNASNDVKRLKAITAWNSSKMINDVSIETAQNDAYTTNGYYNANTLYKIVSKDEDGNEVQKFTNSGGQNIMLRKVNKKGNGTIEYQDTYYVYDEFNNLSFIIPPKAAVFSNITDLKEKLNALCYQYKYDKYNRQVEKKLPGKGWEYLVYDQHNRLVLSQDANLRSKGQWLFSKYDLFGRVIYTGIANGGSREAEQNNVNAKGINNEQKSASSWADSGLNIYYTNSGAYPNAISKVFSVNYYDEYPIGAPSLPAQIQNQQTLPAVPVSITSNGLTSVRSTKTLPTASYIKNIENDSWSSSFVWYDTKARVIGTHSNNYLGGFTRTESLLNFIGKPLEFYTYHSKNTVSAQVTVKDPVCI
ncbi:DUF6443 domain-containing protein [Chryseobacterium nepalense]|uniref:DUF6443 domain-containing protein n=1 Tax=Chryseobacterium nepalense TaxID=1854498 RepID=UPI002E0CE1EC|nr:hypothetical protein [Chryseobacterium nepalense]